MHLHGKSLQTLVAAIRNLQMLQLTTPPVAVTVAVAGLRIGYGRHICPATWSARQLLSDRGQLRRYPIHCVQELHITQ